MTTSLHFYSLTPSASTDVTTSYPLINSYAGTVGLNFDTAQCYGSYFPLQKPYSNTIYLTGTQAIFLLNTPGNLVELEFLANSNTGFIGISSFDSIPTSWYRIYGNASSSTGSTNTSAFSGKYTEVGSWQRIEGNARLLGKWLVIKVENGYAGFRRVGIKSTEEELPFFSAPINYNGGDTVVIRTANTGEWMLGELKDGLKFSRSGNVNTTPRSLNGGNNSEVGEIGVHGDRLVYSKTHVYGDNKLPPAPLVSSLIITQQPQDVEADFGGTATFTITVASTLPPSFQWKKNGVNINGANESSYVLDPVELDDNDGVFTCEVTDGVTTLLSDGATLSINVAITTNYDGLTIPTGKQYTYEIKPVLNPGTSVYHPNKVNLDLTEWEGEKRVDYDSWVDDAQGIYTVGSTSVSGFTGASFGETLYSGPTWSHVRGWGLTTHTAVDFRVLNATFECFVENAFCSYTPVVLVTLVGEGTLVYTTNGSDPTLASTVYTAPFKIHGAGAKTIKAAKIVNGVLTPIVTKTFTIPAPTPSGSLPYVVA
jgi:hypothetical protein